MLDRVLPDFRTPFFVGGGRILKELFDHSNPRVGATSVQQKLGFGSLSLLLLMASGAPLFACSKADNAQGEWPDPSFSNAEESDAPGSSPSDATEPDQSDSTQPDPGSEGGEDDPDPETSSAGGSEPTQDDSGTVTSGASTTGEEGTDSSGTDGTTEDTSSSTGGSSPDQSADSTDTQSTSSTDDASTTSTDTSSENSSSSTQSSSEETTTEENTDPAACELELCVRINDTQEPGQGAWRVGMTMFSFPLPSNPRRVARIELYEGYLSGETKVALRLDAGTSSAGVVEKLQWPVNLPSSQEWLGANLSEPFSTQGFKKMWVVLDNNRLPGRASIAKTGGLVSIWHKASGSQSWSESAAPLMFRAYCCKE